MPKSKVLIIQYDKNDEYDDKSLINLHKKPLQISDEVIEMVQQEVGNFDLIISYDDNDQLISPLYSHNLDQYNNILINPPATQIEDVIKLVLKRKCDRPQYISIFVPDFVSNDEKLTNSMLSKVKQMPMLIVHDKYAFVNSVAPSWHETFLWTFQIDSTGGSTHLDDALACSSDALFIDFDSQAPQMA